MRGCYVEDLTWPEAETAIRDHPTVVLPLGAATKEHGLHLPLSNDKRIAEYLARRVAETCPVLVLPVLAYGFYPAFVEYPGSVSIRPEAFRDTVVDVCLSYARHGSQRFYVLNTGISTLKPLEEARAILSDRSIEMSYMDLTRDFGSLMQEVETHPAGSHADEIETSVMLYIAPEVVKPERAEPDVHERKGAGPFTRDPNATTGLYSPTGAYGDPTLASREKGERIVEGVVAFLVERLSR